MKVKNEMRDDALKLALECSQIKIIDRLKTVGMLVSQQIKFRAFTVSEMQPFNSSVWLHAIKTLFDIFCIL